jgi:hypothetical protein
MEAPLSVTYRNGQPFAAYYRLPRRADEGVDHSRACEAGLVVDLASDGRPLGIEITAPHEFDLATFNRVLASVGLDPVDASTLAPLSAA